MLLITARNDYIVRGVTKEVICDPLKRAPQNGCTKGFFHPDFMTFFDTHLKRENHLKGGSKIEPITNVSRSSRKARDEFVDKALAAAEMPLARFPVKKAYVLNEVRAEIERIVPPHLSRLGGEPEASG